MENKQREFSTMIPNHILVVGGPGSGKLRIADLILGGKGVDDVDDDSHSGIIIKTDLNTKYYQSKLSIMIDEFPSDRSSTTEQKKLDQLNVWCDEFKAEECKELRDVLDGFIFTINLEKDSLVCIERQVEMIYNLKETLVEMDETFSDIFFIVVGVSEQKVDYLVFEDIVIQYGLEFVYFNESGTNEYKEKMGKDRIIEVLESHEWKNTEDIPNTTYDSSKRNKINGDLTQSLLADETPESLSDDVDLAHVMNKLRLAKDQIKDFETKEEKDKFAQTIIDDIINYI